MYHVYYGQEPQRGLVLLTDKRVLCLSATSGQKLWEVALDSTLHVTAVGRTVTVKQQASSHKTYSVECGDDVAATNFRVAVDSARVDLSATRYLLLNLEKSQDEARTGGVGGRAGEEERSDLHLLMENVQDTMVTGLKPQDLRAQPLRSVRVELCHLENKDAHAQVPGRAIISSSTGLLSCGVVVALSHPCRDVVSLTPPFGLVLLLFLLCSCTTGSCRSPCSSSRSTAGRTSGPCSVGSVSSATCSLSSRTRALRWTRCRLCRPARSSPAPAIPWCVSEAAERVLGLRWTC